MTYKTPHTPHTLHGLQAMAAAESTGVPINLTHIAVVAWNWRQGAR